MTQKDVLAIVDHTLLLQTATWEEIKAICDDGMKYETASVCIPTCYVKQAKEYMGDKCKVCTVIGFPNGNYTTATKVFETKDALENGADEIDMVINVGMLKAKEYDYVEGGVANDRVVDTVNLYLAGLIELSSALRELSRHQPNNQICILNQDIINKNLIYDGSP